MRLLFELLRFLLTFRRDAARRGSRCRVRHASRSLTWAETFGVVKQIEFLSRFLSLYNSRYNELRLFF